MEFICTNIYGHHLLCVWLTATVQIQKAVIIIKESDVFQGGLFILEWAELEADVTITNVVSIPPPDRSPGREARQRVNSNTSFTQQLFDTWTEN